MIRALRSGVHLLFWAILLGSGALAIAKPMELPCPPGEEDTSSIRAAALAYLDANEKWPEDLTTLKRFASRKGLSFDLSPFDKIVLVSQSREAMLVEYTTKPPDPFKGAFSITATRFRVGDTINSKGGGENPDTRRLADRITRFKKQRARQSAAGKSAAPALDPAEQQPFDFEFFCVRGNDLPASILQQNDTGALHRQLQQQAKTAGNDRAEHTYLLFAVLSGAGAQDATLNLAAISTTPKTKNNANVGSFSFDMKPSMMGSEDSPQPPASARTMRGDNLIISYLEDRFALYGPDEKRYRATFVPAGSVSHYPRTVMGIFGTHSPDANTIAGVRQLNALSRKAASPAADKGPGSDLVIQIQYGLRRHGYYEGTEDGTVSKTLLAGIARFEKDLAAGRVANPSLKAIETFNVRKEEIAQKGPSAMGNSSRQYSDRVWPNSVEQSADQQTAEGYSSFPEPILYIVPSAAIRSRKLPGTFDQLQRYIADRAVSAKQKSMGEETYVIFAFLSDTVSPTSKFDIKISKNRRGTEGFGKGVRQIDFNGRKVVYMAGSMTLFNSSPEFILYVKAVFTPGEEINTLARYPRLVGRYCTSGI